MIDKKSVYNPWTLEDEKEHPNSILEWWCLEAFFKSIENKNNWTFKADFTEWFTKQKETGSINKFMLYNNDTKKIYTRDIRREGHRLKSAENNFEVKFDESYFKGRFPDYEMLFINQKYDIELFLKYKAKSYPHWIAQDTTNGMLPAGLGFYKYGFIPRGDLSGSLKIENKKYKIAGEGYYEHVWGDFTYHRLIGDIRGLKNSISTYLKLGKKWIFSYKIKIPKTLKFCTENSPLGYDWAWALLDNGWSVFFGNIMFWLMEGPVAGILIFTRDGKTYEEWFNMSFKYNNVEKSKDFDFYYPTDIEINATKGKEKIHMRFKMTAEAREYFHKFTEINYWMGISILESPGIVEGYYDDGKKRIKLSGICKIEPQRQISKSGHNTLEINILKPPEGFGLSFDLLSNILKRNLFCKIHLLPKPKFCFNIKKLK